MQLTFGPGPGRFTVTSVVPLVHYDQVITDALGTPAPLPLAAIYTPPAGRPPGPPARVGHAGDLDAELGSLLSPACTHEHIIKLLGVRASWQVAVSGCEESVTVFPKSLGVPTPSSESLLGVARSSLTAKGVPRSWYWSLRR